MSIPYEIRRRMRSAAVPVVCACAITYFGYHLVEGERGLHAYGRLSMEIERAKQALAETSAERRRLERRVELLRADGLDADMLDEQARAALGLVHADELVIFDNH